MCDIAHGIGKIVALETGAINVVDHLRTLKENGVAKVDGERTDRNIGSRPMPKTTVHAGPKQPESSTLPKAA